MADKTESATEWTGHDIYDLDGNKIGVVEDVRFGDVTGGLQWLVVDTGIFGGKKVFVPAGEVRRSGDRLSVIHTKDRVKDAPHVNDEETLTQEDEGKLCRYYGLQYGAVLDQPAEGCDEMTDVRPAG
jgi:sporulation protein YlmC with PRC-barrel domain